MHDTLQLHDVEPTEEIMRRFADAYASNCFNAALKRV
jgi:hypothetical protein